MKHLYIAINKLKSFVKERPFLFCLFFVGSVACSLMFVYFWGNLRYMVRSYRAGSYTAVLTQEAQMDTDALFDLAEEYGTCLDAICSLDGRVLGGQTADAFFASGTGDTVDFLCTNRMEQRYFWGCEEEDLLKENAVILSTRLSDANNADPVLTLFGKPLQVVGRTSSRYCFVSPETFVRSGLLPMELRLTLDMELSDTRRQAFLQSFEQLTGGAYALTETTADLPIGELLLGVLPMLLIYLLSMFAMLYILMYLLEGMTYELSIYGLIGARNRSLILIPALLQGFLLLAAELVAVWIHQLLYRPLFSRINLEAFSYPPVAYAQAILLMLTVSFAVMLLYLKYRIGGSSVVNLRKNIV